MALFSLPLVRATDANGNPLSGAKLYFYRSETLDPVDVYTTSELDVEHSNPVVADSGGLFAPIYLDPGVTYRAVLKTSADALVPGGDIDPYQGTAVGVAAVSVTLEDFGGAADWNGAAGTDNSDALDEAIASFTFAPEGATAAIGPTILLGSGDYYFSRELDLKKIIRLIGTCEGHNNFSGGTRWHVPINTRAITVNRTDTVAGGVASPNSGYADGTLIQGIQFISAAGSTTTTAHAIWLRARANIEKCIFGRLGYPFGGQAVHIEANSGGSGIFRGNANNWRIKDCYVEEVKGHGLYVAGADANAGRCDGWEVRKCGGCGILDVSGLGSNEYSGINIAGNDNNAKGRVKHGGRNYILISATAGAGAANEPGTGTGGSLATWEDVGAATTWPDWSALVTYVPGLAVFFSGASNRSTVTAPYTEGDYVHTPPPSIGIGGQTAYTRHSATANCPGGALSAALHSQAGIGGWAAYSVGHPGYAAMGAYFFSAVGTLHPSGIASGRNILETRRGADGDLSYLWNWDGADQVYYFQGQTPYWRLTGKLTARVFGRATAVPYVPTFYKLALRDPTDANMERIMQICTTVPASGEVGKGERFWMGAANAGGFAETYVTTGGVLGSTAVTKTANPITA